MGVIYFKKFILLILTNYSITELMYPLYNKFNENKIREENVMTNENYKVMTKRIGSTIYKVKVYFSDTENETMEDKILRNIRNEVLKKSANCGKLEEPQMSRPA